MSRYWYVATPYSRHPRGTEAAFEKAARYAADLIRAGVLIYCPVTHSHPIAVYGGIDRYDYSVWVPINEAMMEGAAGIVVVEMDGWEDSVGVRAEIEWFLARRRPVVMWKPDELVPEALR